MTRLLTDENFDGDIVRGLLRRMPDLDVVRVQDVGLAETPDPNILAWAAADQTEAHRSPCTMMTHLKPDLPIDAGQGPIGPVDTSAMRSKRSRFITLFHAATKSRTNDCCASSHA